jgi:hypothetical protein
MKRTREEELIVRYFQAVMLLALGVLAGGAVFYHFVEDWSWLDSFYFSTVTLTTIGYGDLVPHTAAGKLFTIFYVLAGVGILGAFINLLVKRAALRRRENHPRRPKR